MVDNAKSTKEAVLASELGQEIKRIDIGVRAAKKALKDGVVALDSGYPLIRVTDSAGLEKSYLLALMRQESEFFADAISTSGALGLMQLLPSTAREIARKNGFLPFSEQRLFEPDYNMSIGSQYLGNMVNRYNGSYVLATASYNAGPGRVRQWVNSFGYPKNSVRAVVNWIEGIPFSETRNYVQHVMANMQVYRFMLKGKRPAKLTLAEDLMRGTGQ
jgi:soluble lytic murein transglycosylase